MAEQLNYAYVWVTDSYLKYVWDTCCNPISAVSLTLIFQHATIKTIRLPLNLMR